MERLLSLLERPALAEDPTATALRCANALLLRWYGLCDTGSELVRLQLGFLVHLAVQLLESAHRTVRLSCISVLRDVAVVEGDPDAAACFFPGVCTSLIKLVLHGDFKLGSKVITAACDTWGAWIVLVLSDVANPVVEQAAPLTLEGLIVKHNWQAGAGLEAAPARELGPRTMCPGGAAKLPRVERDAGWLEESAARTSQALCAVLRAPRGASSLMWAEKAAVRRSLIRLSIKVLESCRRTLAGQALDACFEEVLGGIADDDEENRAMADGFLRRGLSGDVDADAEVAQRLVGRLAGALREVQPPEGARLDNRGGLGQRLARADGILCFLGRLRERSGPAGLPAHRVEEVLQPVLRLCALDPQGLRRTLTDSRPLASLPAPAIGQGESVVDLFPYGDISEATAPPACSLQHGRGAAVQSSGGESDQQVRDWLARSLRLADGDMELAAKVRLAVGRLLGAFPAEPLFSAIFDDVGCDWVSQPDETGMAGPFPLQPAALECGPGATAVSRRSSAMYAMAVWLETACQEGLELPAWLPHHCIALALSARGGCTEAPMALHDLCACHLLRHALSALRTSTPGPRGPSGAVGAQEIGYALGACDARLCDRVVSTGTRSESWVVDAFFAARLPRSSELEVKAGSPLVTSTSPGEARAHTAPGEVGLALLRQQHSVARNAQASLYSKGFPSMARDFLIYSKGFPLGGWEGRAFGSWLGSVGYAPPFKGAKQHAAPLVKLSCSHERAGSVEGPSPCGRAHLDIGPPGTCTLSCWQMALWQQTLESAPCRQRHLYSVAPRQSTISFPFTAEYKQ